MAWIEKRASGYRVGWRIGEGRDAPRTYRSAPDKRTAEALRQRVERDIALYGRATLDDVADAPPPLHARLDAWIASLALTVKPRTASGYADSCTLLLRYLVSDRRMPVEALPVTMLDRDAIVGYQAWLLANGRSRTTVAKRAQAVRLAWEWLREGPDRRWLEEAPRRIATRKQRPPRPVAPTWAEADAAVLACHDWLFTFALLARYTGLRRSEILLLEWADIGADGTMLLRSETTKGESSGRRLPLAPGLLAELARMPRDGRWVVAAPDKEREAAAGDGRGHVDRSMRRAWTRAGVPAEKWAGQPCHAFRKTIQTEVELAGVRREVVEYLVGHQPAGTGPRHYLDAERALWPELLEAVRRIPTLQLPAPSSTVVPFRGAP